MTFRAAGTNQVIYVEHPTPLDTAVLDLVLKRKQEERDP